MRHPKVAWLLIFGAAAAACVANGLRCDGDKGCNCHGGSRSGGKSAASRGEVSRFTKALQAAERELQGLGVPVTPQPLDTPEARERALTELEALAEAAAGGRQLGDAASADAASESDRLLHIAADDLEDMETEDEEGGGSGSSSFLQVGSGAKTAARTGQEMGQKTGQRAGLGEGVAEGLGLRSGQRGGSAMQETSGLRLGAGAGAAARELQTQLARQRQLQGQMQRLRAAAAEKAAAAADGADASDDADADDAPPPDAAAAELVDSIETVANDLVSEAMQMDDYLGLRQRRRKEEVSEEERLLNELSLTAIPPAEGEAPAAETPSAA